MNRIFAQICQLQIGPKTAQIIIKISMICFFETWCMFKPGNSIMQRWLFGARITERYGKQRWAWWYTRRWRVINRNIGAVSVCRSSYRQTTQCGRMRWICSCIFPAMFKVGACRHRRHSAGTWTVECATVSGVWLCAWLHRLSTAFGCWVLHSIVSVCCLSPCMMTTITALRCCLPFFVGSRNVRRRLPFGWWHTSNRPIINTTWSEWDMLLGNTAELRILLICTGLYRLRSFLIIPTTIPANLE